MSGLLDNFLSAVADPRTYFLVAGKQADNFNDFVDQRQAAINAEIDPVKKLALQRALDSYVAEASLDANSITSGAASTFVTEYKNQVRETASFSFSLIPWQVWAILALAAALFIYLRFAPVKS